MTLAAQLEEGLAKLRLRLPIGVEPRLLGYLDLLQKWNKVYNLTAIREPEKMVSHHLLDSLAILPHVTGQTLADVGSGAGLPGIPLAVVRPEMQVSLFEVNHKKATFLRQAVIELGLDNATVFTDRVENFLPATKFDFVISRAFAELSEYSALAGHLCSADGTLAAMKGLYPYEEIAQLPSSFICKSIVKLDVPGVDVERHLVLMARADG